MRTVRWAQIALLAVVPACAHTSSGQVENASTSQAKAEASDVGDVSSLAQSENTGKVGRKTRTITLGSAQYEVPTTSGEAQAVVADGTTCKPWAADPAQQCTFEEATSAGIR